MAKIVVYRPDGTEVVRLTPLQRIKLRFTAFVGITALVAFVVAAFLLGVLLALPLILIALLFVARALWQARILGRRMERIE